MRLGEHFATMDGGHPSSQPVPNRHLIELDWYRTEIDLTLTIADDLALELYVPYDVKDQKVRYETLDGQRFDNPLGDLHHRDERLEGLADLELLGQLRIADTRLTLGLSLPTGRIEENPYELAAMGIRHRHIQFGTGTFDPILRASTSLDAGFARLEGSVGLRAPLYENRNGYRGSTIGEFSVGPRFAVTHWLSASVRYSATYQTRATWDGESDENSGYVLQAVQLSFPVAIADGVRFHPSLFLPYRVDVRGGADTFEMDWVAGISLDVGFDAPGGKKRG